VLVDKCHFIGNSATSVYERGYGGGLHLDAGGTVFGCSFVDNLVSSQFSSAYGGAISSNGVLSVSEYSAVRGNRLTGSGTVAFGLQACLMKLDMSCLI